MPLDRQSIEKRDFPIGRRGYEPEAVDAFLAQLADEIDALQRQSRRRSTESLAQAASEQVRAIVEAAETSAADIERAAEEEAAQIRTDASSDAERTRTEAVDKARDHVGQVSEATAQMLQRVTAMQEELNRLVDGLRTGANRVSADLALLEGNMAELYTAAGGDRGLSAPAREAALPITPEVESFELDEAGDEAEAVPAAAAADASPRRLQAVDATGAADEGDVEGARLIALNMALNGQSRAETDRYLAENFDLADRERLLDEVYSSVES
jgi:DivIVA domain-containing protein